jgi:hypothetical protein
MKPLTHTYGLKAIPSEKILKEFHPARGMRFAGPIDLTPEDLTVLHMSKMGQYFDRKSWLGTRLVPDVVPVFRLIAEQMGYDLDALLEGKGETGKPDHSWTVYADEGKAPMLIRWTIGDAQLLLGIVVGPRPRMHPELNVLLLADRKAFGYLETIGDALRQLEQASVAPTATDVPEGNLLKRVLHLEDSGTDFSVRCVMFVDPTQPLSVGRAADLAALQNSAQIIIEEAGDPRGFAFGLKLGEMKVANRKARWNTMYYAADEGIAREFLMILHGWSVEDVQEDLQAVFAPYLQEQRHIEEGTAPEDQRQEITPTIDLELAERRARLELITRELTDDSLNMYGRGVLYGHVQDTFRGNLPTVGTAFSHCPESVLRGTGPDLKMSGGDVTHSADLLHLLANTLCDAPKQYPSRRRHVGKVKVGGVMEAPAIANGYKDSTPAGSKFTEITNPFYASHRGLPVRVDKSVAVWRAGYDTEALAADFFYAPETRDLHVANLYRVKVPKG